MTASQDSPEEVLEQNDNEDPEMNAEEILGTQVEQPEMETNILEIMETTNSPSNANSLLPRSSKKLKNGSAESSAAAEVKPISKSELSPVKKEEGSNKRTHVEQSTVHSPISKDGEHHKKQDAVDLTGCNLPTNDSGKDNSAKRTLFNGLEEDEKADETEGWITPDGKHLR